MKGDGKRTLSKLTYDIVKQLENGHIRIEKPGEEEGRERSRCRDLRPELARWAVYSMVRHSPEFYPVHLTAVLSVLHWHKAYVLVFPTLTTV